MKPMNELLADIVTASGGTVTSNTRNGLLDDWLEAVSNPVAALAFTSQPQAKTVDEYSLATFSCDVTGGVAPYAYQWKKNGTNVGTNSASLSFTAAAADNGASISVVVTDNAGAVITSAAVVLGVTSYAFNFDGISQYMSVASTTVEAADSFKLTFRSSFSPDGFYLSAVKASTSSRMMFTSSRALIVNSGTVITLSPALWAILTDGTTRTLLIERVGNVYTVTVDGSYEQNTITTPSQINFDSLFSKFGSTTSIPYFKGKVLSVQVIKNGVEILSINMNKSLAANQNGGVIVNYNAAGWTAI